MFCEFVSEAIVRVEVKLRVEAIVRFDVDKIGSAKRRYLWVKSWILFQFFFLMLQFVILIFKILKFAILKKIEPLLAI